MVCVHLANHSQWIAQRFSIKCSWLSCCFVDSDETKCPISIFEAVKWEVEVRISSCFSDSTLKDTKNDTSLVGFRATRTFFFFFYPLVVSLKAFFWQGAVWQGIHHGVGNIGLQTTSPMLWSVTAPSALGLFSVEVLKFGWEDGCALSLLEAEVWGHLVLINQKESHHAAVGVQREPACRRNHYLHVPVPGKMRGVKKQDVFQAEQAWVSAQELQVPCLHAQELLRARCSCGRDPPRYSASKYLVSKNLCPLNGHLWVIAGIMGCFSDLLKDVWPVMLNWLLVLILKPPLGSRSSSRCRSKVERRRFVGDKAACLRFLLLLR